jgi:hypothetical protein
MKAAVVHERLSPFLEDVIDDDVRRVSVSREHRIRYILSSRSSPIERRLSHPDPNAVRRRQSRVDGAHSGEKLGKTAACDHRSDRVAPCRAQLHVRHGIPRQVTVDDILPE